MSIQTYRVIQLYISGDLHLIKREKNDDIRRLHEMKVYQKRNWGRLKHQCRIQYQNISPVLFPQ